MIVPKSCLTLVLLEKKMSYLKPAICYLSYCSYVYNDQHILALNLNITVPLTAFTIEF